MKNKILLFTIALISMSVLSFTLYDNDSPTPVTNYNDTFNIPTDVQSIIDNSCYGCHNSESSSTKGKMKLNFDKLSNMKTSKKVGKLMKIKKTVDKGDMPPEKFLKKYPDRKLSSEEKELLISWAEEEASKLGGE